jgi:hypothetical protein
LRGAELAGYGLILGFEGDLKVRAFVVLVWKRRFFGSRKDFAELVESKPLVEGWGTRFLAKTSILVREQVLRLRKV